LLTQAWFEDLRSTLTSVHPSYTYLAA
jgi:hypothetical protein